MKTNDDIRLYHLDEGWEILVGKSAAANETLSLRLGKASDFWFHVAGMPGSHVIARHPQHPTQCPRQVKRVAAGLAAYFSKGKTARRVAVHWTTCGNVSKRKGTPAGQVQLKRYRRILVEPINPRCLNGEKHAGTSSDRD
ncbi:MAG: NFACT RNA binding domain-containing protein [bacterium]